MTLTAPAWLTRWVPPILRRRQVTVLAAWERPIGWWGIVYPDDDSLTEICGALYSQNVLIEDESGRKLIGSRWMPGPRQLRLKPAQILLDSPDQPHHALQP